MALGGEAESDGAADALRGSGDEGDAGGLTLSLGLLGCGLRIADGRVKA